MDEVLAARSLARLDEDWTAHLEGAAVVKGSALVGLKQAGRHRPALPQPPFVLLTHGDCISLEPGAPLALMGGRLEATPSGRLGLTASNRLSLFRPYVSCFFVAWPENIEDSELFRMRLRDEKRTADVVYLRNGDRIEGTVTGLDPRIGCTVEGGDTVHTPWQQIAGIAWNSAGLTRPRFRKPVGHAVLADGARLNFNRLVARPDAHRFEGRTWFGETFEFGLGQLEALDLWNGAATPLSELPAWYEATPYFSLSWPLALDRAVSGRPLRLAGDTFDRGLGMHAASRVTYRLDGKYRWFQARVGVDAGAGPRGRARLAVLVDGKRYDLTDGKDQTAASSPLDIRIPIRGAQNLSLLVDFGSLGDVQAHVDWAGARVVKSTDE